MTPVSLCRINFLSAVQMLVELKVLLTLHRIPESNLTNVRKFLYQILHRGNLRYKNVDETLHLLSLIASSFPWVSHRTIRGVLDQFNAFSWTPRSAKFSSQAARY